MTLTELLQHDDLVLLGGTIRALRNDDGSESENRFGGLVVPFTDATQKDSYGTYFDAATYYGARKGDGVDVAINHGFPIRGVVNGEVVTFDEAADRLLKEPIRVSVTDKGLFGEVWFDLADEYEAELAKAGRAGKLYYSSGALSHGRGSKLFKVAEDGHVERWIIGEVSVTPTPGTPEQRTQLSTLRSLFNEDGTMASITSPEGEVIGRGSDYVELRPEALDDSVRTMTDTPADACYAAHNACLMGAAIIETINSANEDSSAFGALYAYKWLCRTNAQAAYDHYINIYWLNDETAVQLTVTMCGDLAANAAAALIACAALITDATMQALCQSAAATCDVVAAACKSHASGSDDGATARTARESYSESVRSLHDSLPEDVRVQFDAAIRAGATLNKANRADVEAIRDLAQSVLDRSTKEEESTRTEPEVVTPRSATLDDLIAILREPITEQQ